MAPPALADDEFDRPAGRGGRGPSGALFKHLAFGAVTGFVGVLVLTSVLYETSTNSVFAVGNGW